MTVNTKNLTKISEIVSNSKDCKLLIVTKNQTFDDIDFLVNLGFITFGENRVQEAISKYANNQIDLSKLSLHLIGPLQSNKVKMALQTFNVIQTIDRKSLIDEIVKSYSKIENVKTKQFFIQVNIGMEDQKSGIHPKKLSELYEYALDHRIPIKGLMCIPPNDDKPEKYFNLMNNLKNRLNKNLLLSMGMSGDFKVAIKYNSNIVRVGSLLFQK